MGAQQGIREDGTGERTTGRKGEEGEVDRCMTASSSLTTRTGAQRTDRGAVAASHHVDREQRRPCRQ